MTKTKSYDVVIIGGGPGGYVAAVRAAQLGMKVACIEKHHRLGGVCLNIGCIPSKALLDSSEYYYLAREQFAAHGIKTGRISLDLPTLIARKEKVVEELTDNVRKLLEGHKVDIIHGSAKLAGPDRVDVIEIATGSKKGQRFSLQATAIILATGSEPAALPDLEFDGRYIVSSNEALGFDAVPEHLCVVGGGYIGLELGSVWLRLGAKVTVIELLPQIAASLDGQVARKLQRLLKRQGMIFQMQTRVTQASISGENIRVELQNKKGPEAVNCDRLLICVGRRPLTRDLGLEAIGVATDPDSGQILVNGSYRTSVPSIYAIGDLIAGPMLAHKASAEGIAAAECIAGLPGEVNYDAIPAIIYTWPEVAGVGFTEEQVKAQDIPYRVGTYPFAGSGRARCMGITEGFVKIIAHGKTDRVLGVHIIGPRASEMIAECVLALEFGASSEDLARTVHGHPTLGEALQDAAMTLQTPSADASKREPI
jgi:dihydrolipoamide dehydrogenase